MINYNRIESEELQITELDRQVVSSLITNVTNYTIINGGFIKPIGLINGRLGLSLLMYIIGEQHGLTHLFNFANDLLEESYEDIDDSLGTGYQDGAVGIATYFHLIDRYDFISVSRADVLSEIDSLLYKRISFGTFPEMSLANGTLGFLYYLLLKLAAEKEVIELNHASLSEEMIISCLDELKNALEKRSSILNEENLLNSIHAFNLIKRVDSRLYPQITLEIMDHLSGYDLDMEYEKIMTGTAALETKLRISQLMKIYRGYLGKEDLGFQQIYLNQIIAYSEHYFNQPSLRTLVIYLDNMLNCLFDPSFPSASRIILSVHLNTLLCDIKMELIESSNDFSFDGGIAQLLILLQSLIFPDANKFYKELIYLEYEN